MSARAMEPFHCGQLFLSNAVTQEMEAKETS